MSVALLALDAVVKVTGPNGDRSIVFSEFHRLPGDRPDVDTTLQPGELIVCVDLPPPKFTHSFYLKVRDRASYAFALVSVAVALQLEGNVVECVNIALGGVAHKPWCAEEVEKMLTGKMLTPELLRAAAVAATKRACPQKDNEFKVSLTQRSIIRAMKQALLSARGTV
jgi:xanthine dehydrogenase YagS FAD-binding subunit